ncbi:MAG TPA: ABC transporter permease [Stellaceae bacterium]|nr:ABC transporter permease [Stellaceae bacterium]
MFERIWQIVIKEFLELRRDKWARFRLIVPPLVQMLVFGYAATFEVYHVPTVVLDRDQTQESRELISRFSSSDRFDIVRVAQTDGQVQRAIDRGDTTVAIIIHPEFANLLRKGQSAPLQVIVDGTNSNTALIALGYVGTIVDQFSADYAADLMRRGLSGPHAKPLTINLETRPWYNPDLNGRWFFVPGVVASLTLVLVVSLTASAIVREREVGTLEQLMVTPIRSAELILGKTTPFFLIGLAEVALVALFGTLWFHVPFVGNPLILLLGTVLFLLSTLGLGISISTVCKTQQQAFASQFFVLNPMFILSGFSFPISSMPVVLQWLTYLNPMRYYLVVIRGTFIKGVGLSALWPDMLGMAGLGCFLLAVSILRFRKSLD